MGAGRSTGLRDSRLPYFSPTRAGDSPYVAEYAKASELHGVARLLHDDGFRPFRGSLTQSQKVLLRWAFYRERPTGIEPA